VNKKTPLYQLAYSLWIIILGIAFSNCAPRKVQPLASQKISPSVTQTLRTWEKTQENIQNLSGYAEVQVKGKGRLENFEAAILARAPNQLSITLLDDLGQQRFQLIADGRVVIWYEDNGSNFQRVPQEGQALKKALKLPLSVHEFIARLFLRLPQGPAETVMEKPSQGSTINFTRDAITLRESPLQLTQFEAFKGPKKRKSSYRVIYGGFQNLDPGLLAKSLQFEIRKPKVQVRIDFQNLQSPQIIPQHRFDTRSQ